MDVLNPFGLLDGKIVPVEDVPSGRGCGCLCPNCRAPLIARKGQQRVHHFSHGTGADCHLAHETAVHMICKEIIAEHRRFRLPQILGQTDSDEPQYAHFDGVATEVVLGSIRADVLAREKDAQLIIEIHVWHKTEREKIEVIESLGISAVEVSLPEFRHTSYRPDEELVKALLDGEKNRKWLFNRSQAKKIEYGPEIPQTDPSNSRPMQNGPYIVPSGQCMYCRRDIAIVGWVCHIASDGISDAKFICRDCNRTRMNKAKSLDA